MQKVFEEFTLFLQHYSLSKEHLASGRIAELMIAFWKQYIIGPESLFFERGIYPKSRMAIWEQARGIHPAVFKLHEELVESDETVKERVELVLLAAEFSVMSKIEAFCALLIKVIESRREPWGIDELLLLPEVRKNKHSFQLLLSKLVKKVAGQRGHFFADAVNFERLQKRYTSVK